MSTPTLEQLNNLRGSPVIDAAGDEIGTVDQLYYDEATSMPRWVEVSSGLFKMRHALVPIEGAEVRDVELHVPYTREQVQNAPEAEEIRALSPRAEDDLSRHYGIATRGAGGGSPESRWSFMRIYLWPEVLAE